MDVPHEIYFFTCEENGVGVITLASVFDSKEKYPELFLHKPYLKC
jgi:hypothetical protein